MYAQNLRNELTVLARKYAEDNKLNMHIGPKSAVIFENLQVALPPNHSSSQALS